MASKGALMDNFPTTTEIPDEKLLEIVDLLHQLNEEDQLIVSISGQGIVEVEDIYLYQDDESTAKHIVISLSPPLSEDKKDKIRNLVKAVPQEEKERLQHATEEYKKNHPSIDQRIL
jgi:hypothetical protein